VLSGFSRRADDRVDLGIGLYAPAGFATDPAAIARAVRALRPQATASWSMRPCRRDGSAAPDDDLRR
jgi:hypothetical protein